MNLGGPQCGALGAERLRPRYCHLDPYSLLMKETGSPPSPCDRGETEGQNGGDCPWPLWPHATQFPVLGWEAEIKIAGMKWIICLVTNPPLSLSKLLWGQARPGASRNGRAGVPGAGLPAPT